MDNEYEYLYKLILIGNSGVGKTSLIKRYTDDKFQTNYISTIGVDFKTKTIKVKESVVKLQIWDTAGQERFRTITNSYYRGAHGIVVVFDMTDKDSFENLGSWIDEIRAHALEKVELLVIGNKIDMKSKIEVEDASVAEFLKKSGIPDGSFLKVSAMEGIFVGEIFEKMAAILVEREKKYGPLIAKNKEAFQFNETQENGKSNFGCC